MPRLSEYDVCGSGFSVGRLRDRENRWLGRESRQRAFVYTRTDWPAAGVTILADRGFGDHKLFAHLADLGFACVIHLRGNIHITHAIGETRTAANWA